jgi:hypothetical protein
MQFQRKMMLPSIMLVAVLLTASFASTVFMDKAVAVVYAQDSNSQLHRYVAKVISTV